MISRCITFYLLFFLRELESGSTRTINTKKHRKYNTAFSKDDNFGIHNHISNQFDSNFESIRNTIRIPNFFLIS